MVRKGSNPISAQIRKDYIEQSKKNDKYKHFRDRGFEKIIGEFDLMRDDFPNSFFLDPQYDDAIIGINPLTQSIIYDLWHLIRIEKDNQKETEEEHGGYNSEKYYFYVKGIVLSFFKDYQTIRDEISPTLYQCIHDFYEIHNY